MLPIGFQDCLSLRFCVFDTLAQKFFLDFISQPFVQHIDLALNGYGRVLSQITFYGLALQEADKITGVTLSAGSVEHAEFTVPKSFFKLFRVQINGFAGDDSLFQPAAILLQCLEPGGTSLDTVICVWPVSLVCSSVRNAGIPGASRHIRGHGRLFGHSGKLPACCGGAAGIPDRILVRLPVFIQKPDKELFHRHLTYTVDIKIRQDAGDVIKKDPVASHDIEIVRAEPLGIIVQDIGDPVHRHGGFSGTGYALDDNIMIGGFPDDFILFLLDRGHDFTEYGLFVLRQIFCQKVIVGDHFTVEIIQKPARFDFIGALQLQVYSDLGFAGRFVTAFAQSVLVVGVGYRCTPVDYNLVCGVLGDASFADVKGFFLIQCFVVKDNPAEVGFVLCLFVPKQCTFHMIVQGYRIIQNGEDFNVVVVIVHQHLVDVFLHTCDLTAIVSEIVLYDSQSLSEIVFLGLP